MPADAEIAEFSPNAQPIITVSFLISFITGIMSLWPVWGWYTVPLFIIILGAIHDTRLFVPNGTPEIIMMAFCSALACLSPYWIKHEGHWHFPIKTK